MMEVGELTLGGGRKRHKYSGSSSVHSCKVKENNLPSAFN